MFMASGENSFPTKLGALAAVGGLTALTVQAYRYPLKATAALSRAAMLLAGAREGTCDAAGFPIHYYYAGRRGTPLVFIHGLGGSAENWLFLLSLLSREYLVYALDLPGFGRTPLAPEGTNIGTHTLYVQRFLDALDYPRATLVGNSLGGWIATRFTVDNPERVRHLYLLNSAGLSRKGAYSPYTPDRASARRAVQNFAGRSLPMIAFCRSSAPRTFMRAFLTPDLSCSPVSATRRRRQQLRGLRALSCRTQHLCREL